ncbi:trypsin-like peptidase domain-containing protein [Candidatus Shapirobacteria bacterium]|nr:trypsin-like peptidase domain-containing protein [Candidatus Shapirobacteria bacterium]
MDIKTLRNIFVGMLMGIILTGAVVGGAVFEKLVGIKLVDKVLGKLEKNNTLISGTKEIVDEETVVTKVVEKATPSVVTVSISKTNVVSADPFSGFDLFNGLFGGLGRPQTTQPQKIEQDIGTGFVISVDGLIVTNKHVVADTTAKYKVVVGKDEVIEVKEIYRDPVNDLAILHIDRKGLTPIDLGDSDKLKVGQTVIAIGTALGEFRSTVTKGVISGLGRGITAGSPFDGSEKLDNVIQTDAAINPGNSGGPLLNSSGQVIGVNVAVSQSGQSIGFALPINIVRDSINNFKTTGEFERPFLGVNYRMISKQSALLNDVPAGAYVQEVVADSPAESAGIKQGDILIEIDGTKLADNPNTSLATYINKKKIGDSVGLKLYRDEKEISLSVKLQKRK